MLYLVCLVRPKQLQSVMRIFMFLFSYCASSVCYGVSFLSFDPSSMATGGAGSVTGASGAQPYLSPATFNTYDYCCVARAYVGARLIDRQGFLATAEQMRRSQSEFHLDERLEEVRAAFKARTLKADALRDLGATADQLITELNKLPNKPLRVSASAGYYVLGQNEHLAASMFNRQYLVLGAIIENDPQDLQRIKQLQSAVYSMAGVVDGINRIDDLSRALDWSAIERLVEISIDERAVVQQLYNYQDIPGVNAMIQELREFRLDLIKLDEHVDLRRLFTALVQQSSQLDEGDVQFDDVDLRSYLRYQIPERINSRIVYSGAEVDETGLNFSLAVPSVPALALGVNVKEVAFSTIAFTQRVDQFKLEQYQSSETRKDYRFWNIDLGLRYDLAEHWTVGAAIKNIARKRLVTVLGDRIRVDPVARLGIAYHKDRVLVALDADLTKNEPLGFDPHKQYVALGAQVLYWRQNVLRFGYRYNVRDGTGLPAAGIGFRAYGVSVDLAATYSPANDEAGVSLQAGLRL